MKEIILYCIIAFILVGSIIVFWLLRGNYKNNLINNNCIDKITGLYTCEGLIKKLKKNKEATILSFSIVNSSYIINIIGINEYNIILKNIANIIKSKLNKYRIAGYFENTFSFVIDTNNLEQIDAIIEELGIEIDKYNDKYYSISLVFGSAEGMLMPYTLNNSLTALKYAKYTNSSHIVYQDSIKDIEDRINRIANNPEEIKNELTVYYQPKVNAITGKIVGAEALIRWFNNSKVYFETPSLLQAFQDKGIIFYLDMYVCEESCKLLKKLKDFDEEYHVSFNISKQTLTNLNLVNEMKKAIAKNNIASSLLHIEVKEDDIINNEYILNNLDEINKLGVKIDLDLFDGYFNLFNKNIYNGIKIYETNTPSENDSVWLSSIAYAAKKLGLELTIVGVENEYHLDSCRQLSNNLLVQGYCFFKPLSRIELIEAIKENKTITTLEEVIVVENEIVSNEVIEEAVLYEESFEEVIEKEESGDLEELETDDDSEDIKSYEKKTFMMKFFSLDYIQQDNFNIIKNNIMKYKGIKNKTTNSFDTFLYKNKTIIKIAVVGKGLRLFMALDPNLYPISKFPHKDVSNKRRHLKTPYMMKITSNLAVKRAIKLIADLANNNGLDIDDSYVNENYVREMHESMN